MWLIRRGLFLGGLFEGIRYFNFDPTLFQHRKSYYEFAHSNFTLHLVDDSEDEDENENTDKDEEMPQLSDYDDEDDEDEDDDDEDDDDATSESEVT